LGCRVKKKINKYKLSNEIGLSHKEALIRFYYKKELKDLTIDEFAQLWAEIEWLVSLGIIPIKFETNG